MRNENTDDMSVHQAILIVLDRHPELRYYEQKKLIDILLHDASIVES